MDLPRKKTDHPTQFSRNRQPTTNGNGQLIRYLNNIVCFIIIGIRPLLGPAQCRYPISCGNYAIQQFQEKPFCIALWAIGKRLIKCNPFFN